MSLSVRFLDRSFSDAKSLPRVAFRPVRFSHTTIGGPRSAEIEAGGEELALWQLLSMLRYGVELYNERSEAVWWGYVAEVQLSIGAIKIGLSIDRMANRIAVIYSYVEPGSSTAGVSAGTAWAQDDDSVADYGTKELLVSISNAVPAQADAIQAAALTAQAMPLPVIAPGDKSETSAMLICRGWFDTLNWRYHSAAALGVSYTAESATFISLGDTSAQQQVAQQFKIEGTAAYAVAIVKLRISKTGTPTDNLVVDLCADNVSIIAPDTVIATSGVIAGTTVATAPEWITFTFASPPILQPATFYWIKVRRSGAVDAANYYQINANTALGYTDGDCVVYNGSGWSSPTPNADALFEVGGINETTEQISSIATGGAGQFLTGVEVETASGVYGNPYQSGDANAQACIEELLMAGTSAGQRLMCQVTQDRRLVVTAEPELGDNNFYLRRDGRLVNNMDAPIEKTHPVVGAWARLRDVAAAGAEYAEAGAFTMFIEEMEYQAGGNRVALKTRETRNGYDVFRLEQG